MTAGLVLAALAGSGQAVGATADIISTVAGGPGGPDPGTNVALAFPCGVSYGGGHLYIADTNDRATLGHFVSGAVRQMSPSGSELTTVAGNHQLEKYANGGLAADSYLGTCSATVDKSGNLIVSDSHDLRIRVVAATTGTSYGQAMTAGHIYSIAGTGKPGFTGDGGPATAAELTDPGSVTVDPAGNLLFVDGQRIRVVAETTGTYYGQAMTAGDIYTIAGTGQEGYNGDFIPATTAELAAPSEIALDAAGNLMIADFGNARVRLVARKAGTFYGVAMKTGYIYTVAGDGVSAYSGDGAPATSAGLQAVGVTVDGNGNLVIGDSSNSRVRVVAAKTGTFYGQAMTAGDIYTIAGSGRTGFAGDGGPATAAEFRFPTEAAVDSDGNVIVSDLRNYRVRVIAASNGTFYGQAMTAGDIYTIAGTGNPGHISGLGGAATSAELADPYNPALDAAGNLLFLDGNRVNLVAAKTGTFYGQAMTAGDLYSVAGNGKDGFTGDGGPARKAELAPATVTVDAAGNLVIADGGNDRVRVVAVKTGTFYGQAMTAGDIYNVAGDGSSEFSGDFGPALNAGLSCSNVSVDAAGNLVIADSGNNRIRVVAVKTGTFYGIAMTAGDIYTVAGDGIAGATGDGGPALHAALSPSGVAVDHSGNLVMADQSDNLIRVVAVSKGTFYGQKMTAGDIYTVAGDGTRGFAGDGGPATSAEFENPIDVTVDSSGNLLIDDYHNGRIRLVAESTGTFYGIPVTANDIYTVAGDGHSNWSGDGGPATSSSLFGPAGTAVDPAGNLYIADVGNRRIREVSS